MSRLQRYYVGEFDDGDGYMCSYTDESHDGDWVRSDDVEELERERDELKRRVAELEHGTIKITWEPKQFEKLVEHGRMLLIKTKGKTPIELRVASSADDDKYIFDLKAKQ